MRFKEQIESAGVEFAVAENIPVHEEIKIGNPIREKIIDAYSLPYRTNCPAPAKQAR